MRTIYLFRYFCVGPFFCHFWIFTTMPINFFRNCQFKFLKRFTDQMILSEIIFSWKTWNEEWIWFFFFFFNTKELQILLFMWKRTSGAGILIVIAWYKKGWMWCCTLPLVSLECVRGWVCVCAPLMSVRIAFFPVISPTHPLWLGSALPPYLMFIFPDCGRLIFPFQWNMAG